MLSLDTIDAMQAALDLPLDPILLTHLSRRIADTIACDLEALTHIVVIQPGDSEDDLIEAVGFSPTIDRIDGMPIDADNPPDWDWHRYCASWWELGYCVGDSGFAFLVMIPDSDEIDANLLNLCRTYASKIVWGGPA